jgi:hypothetical protein
MPLYPVELMRELTRQDLPKRNAQIFGRARYKSAFIFKGRHRIPFTSSTYSEAVMDVGTDRTDCSPHQRRDHSLRLKVAMPDQQKDQESGGLRNGKE